MEEAVAKLRSQTLQMPLPWVFDWAHFRSIDPEACARMSELFRTWIAQKLDMRWLNGEQLFTVLRSRRRPVRLLRVPEETHELTRSGTPFRRAENLAVVRDWFRHFLVAGRRGLPPLPKIRAGR